MKSIYVIRHCEAEGQPPEAALTEKGFKQAIELATFFNNVKIERIISSPYKRAIQTIQPLAKQLNVEIEINSQLKERVLSADHLPDWFEKLRTTFEDFDLKFKGGESSQEAVIRIMEVIENVFNSDFESTTIVTHGNLMSLLLNNYNQEFGFDEWSKLSNPDVYLIKLNNNEITLERVWNWRG
ncbi:histidine phosphatase family protein [Salipaludibacillus daqingensis]|uniref:histidine phosphatase family protein n=1 Tax=Salipaludibacillus daqingensis TaxID=3041001 RepID=UPI002475547C|nr:histidine phosphatase family protein [Salipaludibacillus daqingensis]